MDGIADMGGMQGWGPVKRPGDEPAFGERWEGRAFALGLLSMRTSGTNLDSFRHALERQSPMNYIADGYYGRWLPRGRDAARRLVDHRARRGRRARPQPARRERRGAGLARAEQARLRAHSGRLAARGRPSRRRSPSATGCAPRTSIRPSTPG